jgi:5-formyltetrahydrofolate cyclo-ligase
MIDKTNLRRELRARRKAFVASLEPRERARLETAVCERVLARLPAAGVVGAYAAFGDEIDPAGLTALLGAERVALPAFESRDAPMLFRMSGNGLERGPFGMMQPGRDAAPARPDVLLVPLVGADERGRRIGQGAGHYDCFLARNPVRTIGLAWEVQLVGEIAPDPWDVPLDAIATPARWIAARGDGADRLR